MNGFKSFNLQITSSASDARLGAHDPCRQPLSPAVTLRHFCMLWAVFGSLSYFAAEIPSWLSLLNIVIPSLYFILRREIRGIEIAINVTMSMVIMFPAFGFWLEGQPNAGLIVCISALFFGAIERLARSVDQSLLLAKSEYGAENFRALLIVAAISVALNVLSQDRYVTLTGFMFLYPLALHHFSNICSAGHKVRLSHAIIYGMLLAFAILSWDKGGRLQFGTFVIVPMIIATLHRLYHFRSWWSFAVAIPTYAAGQFIRIGEGETIGNVLTDGSAADPVRRFLQTFDMIALLPFRLRDFLSQCELFFFGWVPRNWWPSKPVGLGHSLVDDLLSRRGFSLNHSIAPSYVGESIWYLGYYFPLGLLITTVMYILSIRILRIVTNHNVAALAIFYGYISNYAWGGLNTFGIRAWFLLIPLTLYLIAISAFPAKLRVGAR